MPLQWYSPAEAAVADLVRKHSGITPTKWECFEALDRNRDGSYLDAADELLWKYAVERQQLDALSPNRQRERKRECFAHRRCICAAVRMLRRQTVIAAEVASGAGLRPTAAALR